MAGGDLYTRKRLTYQDISGSTVIATGDSATVAAVALATNHTFYIQKIHVEIITGSAKTWTFQDTAGSPVIVATVDTTSAGHVDRDFGPTGYALTEEKGFSIAISGAGAAGKITWEGYKVRTKVAAA